MMMMMMTLMMMMIVIAPSECACKSATGFEALAHVTPKPSITDPSTFNSLNPLITRCGLCGYRRELGLWRWTMGRHVESLGELTMRDITLGA